MRFFYPFCHFLLVLFFNTALFAENDSFQKLRIKDKSFETALLARSEIMSGLIDVIEVDEKKYLVSVGI